MDVPATTDDGASCAGGEGNNSGCACHEQMIMIELNGSELVRCPLTSVWDALSDARFLVQCVPGVIAVSRSEPTLAVCRVRPEFSFVSGTLDLELSLADVVPESGLRLRVAGRGMGTSLKVEAVLQIVTEQTATRVSWDATVKELGGMLKLISAGLIRGAASQIVNDIVANARRTLESAPPSCQ